jgi:hypothetical protein
VLFADASAGQTPQIAKLFGGFSLPVSTQLGLFAVAFTLLLVGYLYLLATGGATAIAFVYTLSARALADAHLGSRPPMQRQ